MGFTMLQTIGVLADGLTTSTDGITWNPQASDLILDLGKYGDFDSDFCTPAVYNNGWKLVQRSQQRQHQR